MNRNYVLAGVGGQGILFITRVLHDAVLREGRHVLVSETHGMAQRGGSVVSHLRVGTMQSPLVRAGTADGLLVFETGELLNTASFLKPGGAAALAARPSLSGRPVASSYGYAARRPFKKGSDLSIQSQRRTGPDFTVDVPGH